MITLGQYLSINDVHIENATRLLEKVNTLLRECERRGVYSWLVDPDTGNCISGSRGGSGDGGYRTPRSTTGTAQSKHRFGQAVDVYDPDMRLAKFLDSPDGRALLGRYELWIEHPRWTPGWVHIQSAPPRSGKRVFVPYNSPPLVPGWPGCTPVPFVIKT